MSRRKTRIDDKRKQKELRRQKRKSKRRGKRAIGEGDKKHTPHEVSNKISTHITNRPEPGKGIDRSAWGLSDAK